jgi:hypothetical protein
MVRSGDPRQCRVSGGHERLAGPDRGLSKYDIFREVMAQFQVHAVRIKPTLPAKLDD